MNRFDIAHVREQGVDLIIVPLSRAFHHKPDREKHAVAREFERRSRAAGLAGTVVLVWEASFSQMGFLAPGHFHAFFQSVSMSWVTMNINRSLSW